MKVNTIRVPTQNFEKHFLLNGNTRILFSGIFGIGKTWFINKFFEEKSDSFIKIHLYPVNYGVGSNKDIFELIKTDILFELLNTGQIDFDEVKLPLHLKAHGFAQKVLNGLIPKFIDGIKDLGETISDLDDESRIVNVIANLIRVINSNKNSFKEYEKTLEENQNLILIKKHFKEEYSKIGGLYEKNIITNLIVELVMELKTKSEKQIILILDDLDRLDPNDIFRLLNIFSAHFDLTSQEENKFGFDKVIFICDANNIRAIYKHKYGQNTDFNGYINKFYSKEIYHFDNRDSIADIVQWAAAKFEIRSPQYFNRWLVFLVISGIFNNRISLRQLIQISQKENLNNSYNWAWRGNYFDANSFPFIKLYEYLLEIFGHKDAFNEFILKVAKEEDNEVLSSCSVDQIECLLPILDLDNVLKNYKVKDITYRFEHEELPYLIYFTLSTEFVIRADKIVFKEKRGAEEVELDVVNAFTYLKLAINKINEINYSK